MLGTCQPKVSATFFNARERAKNLISDLQIIQAMGSLKMVSQRRERRGDAEARTLL